jgi:hypothetical protein
MLWLWSAIHFVMLLKFVELATVCVLGSLFSRLKMPKVRWLVFFSSCLNFYGMVRCIVYMNLPTLTAYAVLQLVDYLVCTLRLQQPPPSNPFPSNYINDTGPHEKYHILLPTQLFFDITDVVPAIALYSLLQESNKLPPPELLLASMVVSATHIILSAWDQGFIHLLTLQGAVLRDAMFAVSDIAGLIGVGCFLPGGLRRNGRVLGTGIICLLMLYLALKSTVGYR